MGAKYTVKDMAEHKGAVRKLKFGERMNAVIGNETLSKLILEAISQKKLVLGVYDGKDMTACLVFEEIGEKVIALSDSYEAVPADVSAVKLGLSRYMLGRDVDRAEFRGLLLERKSAHPVLAKLIIPFEMLGFAGIYGGIFSSFATGACVGMCLGLSIGTVISRGIAWKVETVKEGSIDAAV